MQENNRSKKVSVIGLGLMGSTLARLLIKQGYQVTVWNRTAEKAKTLVAEGAIYNSNVSEVVEASDFIVVCVYDYKATGEIFNNDAVQNALAGKTIIQLTTGSPQEAREREEWAHRYGASYLDGAIMAAPVQMGRADTIILASGQPEAFQQSEEILKIFGGKVSYLGEKIGSASAMDLALLSYTYGATLGFFHGVRIGEVEGFRAEDFGKIIGDFSNTVGELVKYESELIQQENYTATESSIGISIEAVERILKTARDSSINTEFPEFASSIFRQAKDAGYANEELAALIKVFRQEKQVKNKGKANA